MNSNHKPEMGLLEIKEFLGSAKIDLKSINESDHETKSLYRKFYALLVFDYIIQGKIEDNSQKIYCKESVSDASHGFFLTCIGLYKPSRNSLRSAVENFVRFLLLKHKVDALNITIVHELFDEAKKLSFADGGQKGRIESLYQLYRELCKTVHSSSEEYMNLELPFSSMISFNNEKFIENRKIIYEVCRLFGEILFIEYYELIQKSHHSHKDILAESVSKGVRRLARENGEEK